MDQSPKIHTDTTSKPWYKRRWLWITSGSLLLLAAVFVALGVARSAQRQGSSANVALGEDPVAIGQNWSHGECEGQGPTQLTHSPMEPADFGIIIPYGLMIDDHVTPIDHQYFSPADRNSPRDAYGVYAMADGLVTAIEHRTGPPMHGFIQDEYRLEFTQTCTFFYYYDLVTSLSPELKAAFDAGARGRNNAQVAYEVKAGQLIGYIGGQTLDFAVWDTTKRLGGFIKPESYAAEDWKLYTADPLGYYSPQLKKLLLSRYIRTAEPISGKIDYDQPGKLIGNWFLEGTNGYAGASDTEMPRYSSTHLAIAPEHIDPSRFVISIGDFNGQPQQFLTVTNKPWPANVTSSTGLVKYGLAAVDYQTPNGEIWDRQSLVKGLRAVPGREVRGTVLVELTDGGNKLKFEVFPGKPAAQVAGFTPGARIYER